MFFVRSFVASFRRRRGRRDVSTRKRKFALGRSCFCSNRESKEGEKEEVKNAISEGKKVQLAFLLPRKHEKWLRRPRRFQYLFPLRYQRNPKKLDPNNSVVITACIWQGRQSRTGRRKKRRRRGRGIETIVASENVGRRGSSPVSDFLITQARINFLYPEQEFLGTKKNNFQWQGRKEGKLLHKVSSPL